MGKLFEIPDDIVKRFFEIVAIRGKYQIEYDPIEKKKVFLLRRTEEEYYKPRITIINIDELEASLKNYIHKVEDFYSRYNILEPYQDLNFFLANIPINMSNVDAQDLVGFINKRVSMFEKDVFDNYLFNERKVVQEIGVGTFYAYRILETPNLETPYCMAFCMECAGKIFELPLVRYYFQEDICYIYAVQMGKDRNFNYQDLEYKKTINKLNTGLKEYRNIPPNFVLSLVLFLKMLSDNNISKVMIPDYLFGRYKKYLNAKTELLSDAILPRILDNFLRLLCRMNLQIDGFDILTYPEDYDSYMRIKIGKMSSKNEFLNELLNGDNTRS